MRLGAGCSISIEITLVFDYYKKLSAKRQSIYRQSDAINSVKLPDA